MPNKYISDIIPNYEIQHWGLGDKILINAPTGSGKSYFVIHILNKHAESINTKILFLTNRKLLKEQIEADVGMNKNIKVMNYQQLTMILKQSDFKIDKYKYVVADECHFFYSDSYFNSETDITLEYLTNLKSNVALFLSATCEIFKEYMQDKKIIYYGLDNELIYENLYYFDNEETIVRLLESLPKNEKAIYFCSNIANAFEFHKKFDNSAFLCSNTANNKKYLSDLDDNIRNNIIANARFEEQILFTTKILDNGVNIKDLQLKHIIIDIYDFDTIQQCIGRKRILNDDDKINIYIKRFKQNSIQSYVNQWKRIKKYGDEFQTLEHQEYVNKYGRSNTNGLIYPKLQDNSTYELKLNEAFYYKLDNDIKTGVKITELNKGSDIKLGHLQILCERYKLPIEEFKCLDDTVTTDTFNSQLNNYTDIKMFKDEQKVFKEFIKDNAVKTVDKNNSLGINTINGYFEDNDIGYILKSHQETGGTNKGKRYWQLYKLVSQI